nr:hypothetical protein [Escherichia coli]
MALPPDETFWVPPLSLVPVAVPPALTRWKPLVLTTVSLALPPEETF